MIDNGLGPGARSTLLDAVLDLNVVQPVDATHNMIAMENVQLANEMVFHETATDATLRECNTYTALVYTTSPDPQRNPGASEMTVGLTKTDTGYLHSIIDGHLVDTCDMGSA